MKNFLIFFIKRTTIFQKLYQRSTEPAKQKQVLVKLIPPTCIRTQELQGGLWFKTASMRQASHTSLLCACFIILTFASRHLLCCHEHWESENARKNQRWLRSTCDQNFGLHFLFNFLMDFYQNEAIVKAQKNSLQFHLKCGQKISRDRFHRFAIVSDD